MTLVEGVAVVVLVEGVAVVVLVEGVVAVVLVADPAFVALELLSPLEFLSPLESWWSVTVDNGLITVVRCVTAVVVVVGDNAPGRRLVAARLDVTVVAWCPTWSAEGTCVAAPPVPMSVTKRTAPAATNNEQSHIPHRVPVNEDLSPRDRTRDAPEVRAASSLLGPVISRFSYI